MWRTFSVVYTLVEVSDGCNHCNRELILRNFCVWCFCTFSVKLCQDIFFFWGGGVDGDN